MGPEARLDYLENRKYPDHLGLRQKVLGHLARSLVTVPMRCQDPLQV